MEYQAFFQAGEGHIGQNRKKMIQKPAPGQDLSNDTKYEKIWWKEPRVQ